MDWIFQSTWIHNTKNAIDTSFISLTVYNEFIEFTLSNEIHCKFTNLQTIRYRKGLFVFSSPSLHTVWRLLCNNFSPSSVCKFVHAPATEVGSRSADWLHMLLLQLHLATQMMQNAIPIATYRIPNGQELQLSSELAPGPVHPRGKVHVRKVVVDSIGKLHRHDEVHQRS